MSAHARARAFKPVKGLCFYEVYNEASDVQVVNHSVPGRTVNFCQELHLSCFVDDRKWSSYKLRSHNSQCLTYCDPQEAGHTLYTKA